MNPNTNPNPNPNNRVRSWCYTLNVPDGKDWDDFGYITDIECEYHCFGQEVAPTTGQKHFQGFIHFKEGKTMKAVKNIFQYQGIALFEKKGTFEQASDYCLGLGKWGVGGEEEKPRNPTFSKGDRPCDPHEKGTKSKDTWKRIVNLAEKRSWEALKEDYPQVYVSQIGNLQKVAALAPQTVASLNYYPGWFICGPPGTGKTRLAYELAGGLENVFPHPGGKWWDGYSGQSVVLFDDLTPEKCKGFVSEFKTWFDLHAFRGEIKASTGGTGLIRPRCMVITSNYTLNALFPRDEDNGAMGRRFPGIRDQDGFKWGNPEISRPEHVAEILEENADPNPAFGARNGTRLVNASAPGFVSANEEVNLL
nr:MAG: replication associated protein [Cressdnaviricota sp.]